MLFEIYCNSSNIYAINVNRLILMRNKSGFSYLLWTDTQHSVTSCISLQKATKSVDFCWFRKHFTSIKCYITSFSVVQVFHVIKWPFRCLKKDVKPPCPSRGTFKVFDRFSRARFQWKGCGLPKSSHLIGKVVSIETLIHTDSDQSLFTKVIWFQMAASVSRKNGEWI